ncbi:MAG: hypothetical protein E6274_11105 [Clostridium sp.]|uniref:hypothetical protein n=1 Tax=Clostridium sp. TaxID=1506 RepID=UPI00290B94E2|nr:hypothetical protein [Clostridium sp.]MDU7252864.1 hypothetical protein [Clostridium sp.]
MSSYQPDSSGINSLGGFAYQIKVFVSYLLSMKKGMQAGFETLDDLTVRKLTPEIIDINEDKFRSLLQNDRGVKAIQVKRTTIDLSVAKKILLNWVLLENSCNEVSEYILFTDKKYNNNDIIFNISEEKLFKEIETTNKTARATIGKVKKEFKGKWDKFKSVYDSIYNKYKFISLENIDSVIDSRCEILFKKEGVQEITYYRRIKELLQHITFEIMEAVNNKKSYMIKFEDMIAYAEDVCSRFKDDNILPQYSEFKKTHKIDFNDLEVCRLREYKQLVACKLPINLIEQNLNFANYYRNSYYSYMELNNIGRIRDIEETTYENFENAKFFLQTNKKDTPYNRLTETKNMSNSYADSDHIKYGSSIYLTREEETENQISWEDEDNAGS